MENAIREILIKMGENPEREGLRRTPERVAETFLELTAGYREDPEALLKNALFEVDYDEMVVVKNIDYHSLCEHHLLPFFGRAHIAYIPKGKVIGLSKIPQIVEMFARRLQVQERMTAEIANFINEAVRPMGVAVVLEGTHLCMVMRGIKKVNTTMTTSAMRGIFRKVTKTRAEFMEHIKAG